MCMYEKKQALFKQTIAVTNRSISRRPFLEQITEICSYHPYALILREKDLPEEEYAQLGKKVLEICEKEHVLCILHTYVAAVQKLGCSAIHVPLPLLKEYAEQLRHFSVVGTSVHSVEEAILAEKLGATYLIAGHIFATDCKKGVPPRGISFLHQVCQAVSLPVYGIGGMKFEEEQQNEVIGCGAKGVCIMSEAMNL